MIFGYASGAFDTFHIGHLNLLRRASFLCDYLLVGVVTDDAYEQMRGQPPIVPFAERLEIVRYVRFVDAAVGDPYTDKRLTWELYRFDVLIKGDDWKDNPKAEALLGRLAEVGVGVEFVPYTRQTSSTRLRHLIGQLRNSSATGEASEAG